MTTTSTTTATCRRCGKPLYDPRSIALGVGPGCSTALRPSDLDQLVSVAAKATSQLALEFTGDE